MKTPLPSRALLRTLLVALTLGVAPLALTACGGGPPDAEVNEMPMDEPMMDGSMMDKPMMNDGAMRDGAEPRMEDGVQVVDVEAGATFSPDRIRLVAGVPARLVVTRTVENTCVTEVMVPAYDVGPVALPLGEPVAVEFTPTEAGDVSFACGMDMVTGQIVVSPAS